MLKFTKAEWRKEVTTKMVNSVTRTSRKYVCPRCGYSVIVLSNYCPDCGKNLGKRCSCKK